MAGMNIKDPEVRELAIKLARRRHTSMTDAVRQSLTEALEREDHGREGMAERLLEIGRRAAAKPGAWLTDDDLYDENGLPR
jgi:antitoxin VapB